MNRGEKIGGYFSTPHLVDNFLADLHDGRQGSRDQYDSHLQGSSLIRNRIRGIRMLWRQEYHANLAQVGRHVLTTAARGDLGEHVFRGSERDAIFLETVITSFNGKFDSNRLHTINP